MKAPKPWLCGLAVVVALYIVEALFNSPATKRFRTPLMLAAYVIGIVLFFKLGAWPAFALWYGIGLVIGLIGWSHDFRRARYSKEAQVKAPSVAAIVRGLFVLPIIAPPCLLLGYLVVNVDNLLYRLYKRLLPNRVPRYRQIERCKEAAISGDAEAQFTLGCAYERGEYGLPQDHVESAKWFRKAAEQNYYAAQLRLGICLAEGKGVEKNLVEGLMWIFVSDQVSARHGGGYLFRDAADQVFRKTKAQMTEQQIAETWTMLDASPLSKEIKRQASARYAKKPASTLPVTMA